MAATRAWNEGLVGSCWLSFSLSKKPSSFSPASCYLFPGALQTDASRSPSMSQHLLLSESRVSISSAQMISLTKAVSAYIASSLLQAALLPLRQEGCIHCIAHTRAFLFFLPTFLSPHWCHRLKMPSTGTEPPWNTQLAHGSCTAAWRKEPSCSSMPMKKISSVHPPQFF